MQYVGALYKTNMLYFSEPSNNENKSWNKNFLVCSQSDFLSKEKAKEINPAAMHYW